MRHPLIQAAWVAGFALSATAQAAPQPIGSPSVRGGMAPARSGDVAVRQELDAARRAGTRAAYSQFIARHGHHTLAGAARIERSRLPRGP
jgi:hypothetical protein